MQGRDAYAVWRKYLVPATCPCCSDSRLRKIGRGRDRDAGRPFRGKWKAIQRVRSSYAGLHADRPVKAKKASINLQH